MKDVLLVDDDLTCNFIHKKILQLTGFVGLIDIAHNGSEALMMMDTYIAAQRFPHLILLDINMPVLDGFEFLRWYNQLSLPQTTNARIIVLSSSINPADMARAKSLGVDEYIKKPLQLEQMMGILKGW